MSAGPAGRRITRRTALSGSATLAAALLAGTVAAFRHGGGGPVAPVAIGPEDTCARCGMMISDPRQAAEIVGAGTVWKFDDLGELFAYRSEHRIAQDRIRGVFVHDYFSRGWLPARQATYVSTPRLRTPMSFGFAAFGDAGAAGQYARSLSGTVHSFSSLMVEPVYPKPNGGMS